MTGVWSINYKKDLYSITENVFNHNVHELLSLKLLMTRCWGT